MRNRSIPLEYILSCATRWLYFSFLVLRVHLFFWLLTSFLCYQEHGGGFPCRRLIQENQLGVSGWGVRIKEMTDCKKLRWKTQERFGGTASSLCTAPILFQSLLIYKSKTKHSTVSQNLTIRPSLSWVSSFLSLMVSLLTSRFNFCLDVPKVWNQQYSFY